MRVRTFSLQSKHCVGWIDWRPLPAVFLSPGAGCLLPLHERWAHRLKDGFSFVRNTDGLNGTYETREVQVEYFVPLARAEEALAICAAVCGEWGYDVFIITELRAIRGDEMWLTVLGVRGPRNCFWVPRTILCTNSLYESRVLQSPR